MRKTEVPHNAPEQVRLYIEAALELTEALDPPDDLRSIVFLKAVDLLSAKQLFFEQSPAAVGPMMAIPRNQH